MITTAVRVLYPKLLIQSTWPSVNVSRKIATIIDGVKVASELRSNIKRESEDWIATGHRPPHLTVVLVGEDPASAAYIRNKVKACKAVGFSHETIILAADVLQTKLLSVIDDLNQSSAVDALLVQLPLPKHIDETIVCNSVKPTKDVDGFHLENVGKFCRNMKTLLPCTPVGVMYLLRRYDIETFGKHVVICGRSKNVGMPLAMMLHSDQETGEIPAGDATTTICHRYTPPSDLKKLAGMADVVISATGIPGLITADMIKPGAAVIDIGISKVLDPYSGKKVIVGDVDFPEVSKVAGFITPVPGGVGPMTVAMLMQNTLLAAKGLS